MSAIDWTTVGLGAFWGTVAGAAFFAGLAWGMALALRRRHARGVLLISAALRIAALLALGWWIAGLGAAALAGFVAAFMAVRCGVLIMARPPREAAPWS